MKYLQIAAFLCLLPASLLAQSAKTKPTGAKPKPSATPVSRPPTAGDKAQFDKAAVLENAGDRVAALVKFNTTFPRSARRNDALEMIASSRVEMGNTRLSAGDIDGAIAVLKLAAAEAPKPISDKLWKESLADVPGRLYLGGARNTAYEIANSLEEKAEANGTQLLDLASFYLGVEDGEKGQQVAEKLIVLDPNSTLGYQALGFAHRVNFQLDEAAAAFAKALELEPGSSGARRSLAEMKRALGKSDEAAALYREALIKDETDLAAATGLVLALFDSGKRSDAEAELTKALSKNDTNVMLLGNVAYWYAVQGDGDRAIELAQKAIAADPRFIWSHIALARGYILKGRSADAEKTLFLARQYGNFPELSYEIAAAKAAGGYYREAAEELAKAYVIKNGVISTRLGGRVPHDSKDLTDLVGLERRASIFAPTAADDPDNAVRLAALLELKQELDSPEPNTDSVSRAAEAFTAGTDRMRIHRQIFAASQLLERKVALAKVIEMTKAASLGVDAAADVPDAAAAVMASELYAPRGLAATRGEYVNVPPVQKTVLLSILRGRIEDMAGWAGFQMDQQADAVVRLRRAVGILPGDSAWWRASLWHLGAALAAVGKDQEALDNYVKAYRSASGPDPLKYSIIRGLYVRINGKADGLESLVGEGPVAEPVANADAAPVSERNPTPVPETPMPTPSITPTPTSEPVTPTSEPQKPTTTPDQATQKSGPSACTLTSSEDSLTLTTGGGDLAIMIGSNSGDLEELKATSSSPADISITREIVAGVRSRAVFVIRSASGRAGDYTLKFDLSCGSKEVSVRVR